MHNMSDVVDPDSMAIGLVPSFEFHNRHLDDGHDRIPQTVELVDLWDLTGPNRPQIVNQGTHALYASKTSRSFLITGLPYIAGRTLRRTERRVKPILILYVC